MYCIELIKEDYPNFEPAYDKEFFEGEGSKVKRLEYK
jgi:hypothetical protein